MIPYNYYFKLFVSFCDETANIGNSGREKWKGAGVWDLRALDSKGPQSWLGDRAGWVDSSFYWLGDL